jgi:hypothetical protein
VVEIGTPLFKVKEGSPSPLINGTSTLQDGTTILINQRGEEVIAKVFSGILFTNETIIDSQEGSSSSSSLEEGSGYIFNYVRKAAILIGNNLVSIINGQVTSLDQAFSRDECEARANAGAGHGGGGSGLSDGEIAGIAIGAGAVVIGAATAAIIRGRRGNSSNAANTNGSVGTV